MKFNEGDIVIVREDLEKAGVGYCLGNAVILDMLRFAGQKVTISEIVYSDNDKVNKIQYKILEDGEHFWWTEKMFNISKFCEDLFE